MSGDSLFEATARRSARGIPRPGNGGMAQIVCRGRYIYVSLPLPTQIGVHPPVRARLGVYVGAPGRRQG